MNTSVMVANHVPLRNFGKSAVYEIDSQTLPNTCYLTAPVHARELTSTRCARGKVFPPVQEFGKRSGVFRILMPTAPTRIKLSPRMRYGVTQPQVLKLRIDWHGKRCERGLESSEARLTGVPRALLPRQPRCVSRGGPCCRAEGRKNLVSAQDVTKATLARQKISAAIRLTQPLRNLNTRTQTNHSIIHANNLFRAQNT